MLVGGDPGPWGPTVAGGSRHRFLKRFAGGLGVLVLVLVSAVGTTGLLLYLRTDGALTRVPVDHLDRPLTRSDARYFLLVGSDARDGLTGTDRRDLSLGSFDGQRSDTMIYVAISEDRSQVSLVSLPRDLLVFDELGRRRKLTETYAGGAGALIETIQRNFELPINHFAEVSLGGFTEVVRTLGGVEICLDEPLVDRKAGADLPAGCNHLSPTEALSFVRSRQGIQGDYERIDRQQTFLRAVLGELVDGRVLTNPAQLFRLVDDVAGNVTTDSALGLSEIRYLVDDLRGVISSGVPMTTVPSYARTIDGISFVLLYEPGARAMFSAIVAGEPVPERATREEAADVVVAVWSGGRVSAGSIVVPTLAYAGYQAGGAGSGPAELRAGDTSVVYRLPGRREEADRVAALLGAEVRPLPEGATAPDRAHVVVSVGDDAAGGTGS